MIKWDMTGTMARAFLMLRLSSSKVSANLVERIVGMKASGMTEEAVINSLRKDLMEGGPIFAGFNSQFRQSLGGAVEDMVQGGILQGTIVESGGGETSETGIPQEVDNWLWLTVGDSNVCGDCDPRHGEIRPYSDWAEAGLPRSGFSICNRRCRCDLVPADQVPGDFGDKVVADEIAQMRKDFAGRMESDVDLQQRIRQYEDKIPF